ncbi:amidase family protein [Streptomyces sp. NPDC050619]|uniref:amidase family protein n=1 Tax=Streptomyces sp. NPDC050619 TaxID=3157214 RepID=UPI0034411873
MTAESAFVPWLPVTEAAAGRRMAVKDVIDVAGLPTGAGHPLWRETHPVPGRDAEAVARLRSAGFTVIGKTHTDELAYSLAGTNAHYGTPENPAAPGCLPGGSSSGSGSAVAANLADLALGTDTAGSIRVPASYTCLIGFRPTHSRAPRSGIVPLAPSFDTPGLIARDLSLLRIAVPALLAPLANHSERVLRPTGPGVRADPRAAVTPVDRVPGFERVLVPTDLPVAAEVRDAVLAGARALGVEVGEEPLFGGAHGWERARAAFAVVQGAEAWACHGEWIRSRRPRFGPGVAARFAAAEAISADEHAKAREIVEKAADLLHRVLSATVVALPTTPGPAPRLGAAPADRLAVVRLTCLAPIAGAPALSLPALTAEGLPLGLSLIASPGLDESLLDLAADLGRRGAQD